MTKKHFEMMARVLRANRLRMTDDAFAQLVADFAREFKKNNPRFDAARFFEAAAKG